MAYMTQPNGMLGMLPQTPSPQGMTQVPAMQQQPNPMVQMIAQALQQQGQQQQGQGGGIANMLSGLFGGGSYSGMNAGNLPMNASGFAAGPV